jgi:hypothetical protein
MGSALADGACARMHVAWSASAVALVFLMTGCFNDPLEPVVPRWDVNLTIPLVNRTYTLAEVVRKNPGILQVGVGNEIIYASSPQLVPTIAGNVISIAPPDTAVRVKFGKFSVSAAPLTIPMSLSWLPPGVTIPVPDTTVDISDLRDSIATFQSVTFASGTMSLTLINNLPLPMDVVNPIQLLDGEGQLVATFTFTPPQIEAHSQATASDDLAGKRMTSAFRVTSIRLHTPGSPTPVTIPGGDLLVARLSTANAKARQAVFAEIPAQRLQDNDTARVTLDDSTLVQEMRIASGRLDFNFTNRVDLDMLFKFQLDEVQRNSSGFYIPFEDSVFLPSLGSGSYTLDLGGVRFRSLDGDLMRTLRLVSSVILPGASGRPVTVNDTDKIEIHMTRSAPIIADTAVGVLKPTWIGVDKAMRVDFGDLPTRFSGQLNIPAASLGIRTSSSLGFPCDLFVRIGARRSSGDSAFISIPAEQRRLDVGEDVVQFDATAVGQFLSQFSGRLPDSLRVTGTVLVNPPDVYTPTLAGVGAIGRNSSLAGRLDLQVPLMLGIVSGTYGDTLVIGDSTGDGRKDFDLNKDRINDVNSGSLYIEIENGMPLQVGVQMRLLDSLQRSLLLVPQNGSTVGTAAASVDPQGNVTVPAHTTSSFSLDQSEVRQFNPTEFVTYAVSLTTTPGSPAVRFRTTDYLRVRIWSRLSYRVNR